MEEGTLSQPRTIEIPVMGGEQKLVIRTWTMGQSGELAPKLAKLVRRWGAVTRGSSVALDLGEIFTECEFELRGVARQTVLKELEKNQIEWDDLHWEDLMTILQAIWETSMVRPGGGGMLGKLGAVLGPQILKLIEAQGVKLKQPETPPSGTSTTTQEPKPKGSPSSQEEDTETLSTSDGR